MLKFRGGTNMLKFRDCIKLTESSSDGISSSEEIHKNPITKDSTYGPTHVSYENGATIVTRESRPHKVVYNVLPFEDNDFLIQHLHSIQRPVYLTHYTHQLEKGPGMSGKDDKLRAEGRFVVSHTPFSMDHKYIETHFKTAAEAKHYAIEQAKRLHHGAVSVAKAADNFGWTHKHYSVEYSKN